jgi:hypothetical protein
VSGYSLQTDNLQVNTGGLAFATAPVIGSHNVQLQGGFVSAGLGWTSTGSAQISGFGQLAGPFSGGAGNSILASGGALALGDVNNASGFNFAGTTSIAPGAALNLLDSNQATLGSMTTITDSGRLASFNGVLLGTGQVLSATGNATVDGAFTNQGTVNGPTGTGQLLTFIDGVNGAGGYTGNILFSDGFAPGNSPGIVTFAGNVTYDATSEIEMELGGLAPGTGYDKIEVSGLLTLGGGALDILYWDGFMASSGDLFDLFDWGSISGTFGQISLPGLSVGLFWDVSRLYVDGTISVGAVPEPEIYAMMAVGLGLLGWVGRRRKEKGVAV